MRQIQRSLMEYLAKIAHTPKTIEEKMKEQDMPTIPAKESKDEKALYEELLKLIRQDKKIEIAPEFEKEAAPKGVKDKALWNKIEKGVRKHNKYTDEQVYKVVQKAYQKAGGIYTHKTQ